MWWNVWLVCCVCFVCFVCGCLFRLGDNSIGAEGAAAIGAGLHGVPSLTSLEYVMQAWVMPMMGRGHAEWFDGECFPSWCGVAWPGVSSGLV